MSTTPFNSDPSKRRNRKNKIIPLKSKRRNITLEYFFLSLEKLNDTLKDHLKEESDSNRTANE